MITQSARLYLQHFALFIADLQHVRFSKHVWHLVNYVAYVDVQAGEVWTEVMSELQVENVRPVTPDHEALEAISTAVKMRAEQVKQVQQELLDAQKQQDLMEEQEFYAQVSQFTFYFVHSIVICIGSSVSGWLVAA